MFDVIEVIGGKNNPRKAWLDMKKEYPEVVTLSNNFQFPGQGQRQTPVTNKEGLLRIIGLLPGAVGRTYREDAAKLMLDKIEGRSVVVASESSNLALPHSPKEISEAIACVLSIAGIVPLVNYEACVD